MKVKDIMKRCRTISEEMNVMEAAIIMNKHHIGSLVVLQEDGYETMLSGIVTERDILEKVTARNKTPSSILVRDIMTKKVITIGPEDYIDDAVYLMIQHKIKKLPVINKDNELVGIITSTDIIANSSEVGEFYMFE